MYGHAKFSVLSVGSLCLSFLFRSKSLTEYRYARSIRSASSSESDADWFRRTMSDTTNAHAHRRPEEVFGWSESLGCFRRAVSEQLPPKQTRRNSVAAFDGDLGPLSEWTSSSQPEPELPTPALYNWTWASCFAFLGYVLITGNDSIVKAWSKGRSRKDFPYAVSSVMLLSGITSFVIGILAAFAFEQWEGLKKCFNYKAICRVGCVNVFFQLAGILKFKALTRVPPDAVSILSQMNLFLLALAIRVVFNKFFSLRQWLCLAMICNGVILYMISREGEVLHQVVAALCLCSVVTMYTRNTWKVDSGNNIISLMLILLWILAAVTLIGSVWQALPQSSLPQAANGLRSADVWWGCLDILGMCCCESFASVSLERYFKNDEGHYNFYIQKVHVDCSSILFSSILFGMSKSTAGFPSSLSDVMVLPGALFAGWDSSTVVVLSLMVCKAWLAGLVAKMLDSVVKQVGSCTAIALMFLEMNCWERFATVGTTSSVGIIVLAILNFTELSRSKRDDQEFTKEYPALRMSEKENDEERAQPRAPPPSEKAKDK
ncbi:hypothetical protein AK812_SmicGene34781 [Symbiodinium microadriaticum]|uniref:Uncharacterized protein n=1 Tax=Symbiodinium microadriaticum TaxID=2951 RepID=A0A1Q9CN65_SYMMI|nr:hypothetical protein AK812_SmicGene34781 [Symbiodinium microadriaticum]